ncbi:sulfate adenylyltransferase subunit 2, partial [Alphaproteobacteria bacterium]|nr:sulfate adenylyltransferase subunit 2 [Alphaproteobacteria bacterium]
NPVMLYSIGKDSSVLLHLAKKAFFPDKIPFPLLHVDTTWKFSDMYEFKKKVSTDPKINLITYKNEEALKQNINPFDHGTLHTEMWKTDGLKKALDLYNYDIAIAGARRDEELSRAKERIFSFRLEHHRWDPKNQKPELWSLFNTFKNSKESIRTFPLSNWTELDIWEYIKREKITISNLYFSKKRLSVLRDDQIFMVDDKRFPLKKGEVPKLRSIRFRTLGCYPLTAGIISNAKTLDQVILETMKSKYSERNGRVIDKEDSYSLEMKKRQGYF